VFTKGDEGSPAGASGLHAQAKRVFAAALEQPADLREAHVAQACGDDTDLYREVISLLQNYDDAASFFDRPPVPIAGPPPDPMVGKSVGPYRILRRIGSGGMGAVYLAERADAQFRKRVALKAVRAGLIDEHVLRRFQNERHTLAVLDHPNIIKLLDAGSTDDGLPYLVTEYVEGQRIDAYCVARRLSVAERIELFRVVLSAVHCAHQSLVVHRDLKPGNILVTPEGVPKLLDFGIAKLVRPEYGACMGLTSTEFQPMTPEFASPEQILGQPITTASDIYSLGVILYCLLAGGHPFELRNCTAAELERTICQTVPEKPSRFVGRATPAARADARLLRGDLDTIILMAMRKEPQRRYPSAEHFSEDLRRYLERRPVAARKAGMWYKAAKFTGRHKAACAAAPLVAAALIASGAMALGEKRAAERRFEELRQFANFVLNDLDEKLIEGVTPARSVLAAQGLKYLDGVAGERRDPAILRDLVNGYIKNGDVQGDLYVSNLGDTAAAERSYRKALRFAQELVQSAPADPENLGYLFRAHLMLGQVLTTTGNRAEAQAHIDQALRVNESMLAARPSDLALLKDRFSLWFDIGSARSLAFDPEGALESYHHALETAQAFPDSYSSKPVAIASARELAAYWSALTGDPAGAEEVIRQSIAVYQRAIAANPKSRLPRTLAKALKNLADVQKRAGRLPEALAAIRQSLGVTRALLAEDPRNARNQIDLQQALLMEIDILSARGLSAEAKQQTKLALEAMKPQAEAPNSPYQHAMDYAELLATTPFADLRDDAAGLRYASQALAMTHEMDPGAWRVLALAYQRNGQTHLAAEADRKALSLLPAVPPGHRAPELLTTLQNDLRRLSPPAAQSEPPQ
jgi:non-specific serine/threonine protein kinase/serine/threonine-protein kinase